MDAYQKLAGEIVSVMQQSGGNDDLLRRQVLLVLGKYSVETIGKTPKNNVAAHVEHFLSAKRIEGLSDKTLTNYRFYLTR